MKKVFKSRLFTFILGILVTSGIGVIAYSYNAKDISYTPSDSNWNVNTVGDAIDSLKVGTVNKFCELKTGDALAIGSMYECNPSLDGETKYNFYVLRTEGNAVKLIMERNISDTVGSARTMDWKTAMNFFRNGAGKNLNWKTGVELPRAQDIADAVGNTGWNLQDKDYNGWFCLGLKDHVSCSNNEKWDKATDEGKNASEPYKYLFNYTRECSAFGCDSSTSLDSNYAYGYWTGDMVSKQLDTTARAWLVYGVGHLSYDTVSGTTHYGVRPVITISKSNIK